MEIAVVLPPIGGSLRCALGPGHAGSNRGVSR
jgi:hypothetical protein